MYTHAHACAQGLDLSSASLHLLSPPPGMMCLYLCARHMCLLLLTNWSQVTTDVMQGCGQCPRPCPPPLPSPWPSPRPSPPGPSSFLRIVVTHAKLEPSAATDGCNFNTATLRLNGFPSLLDFLLFFTAYLSSPFFRSLHPIGATATRSLAGSLLLPPHRHPRSTASRANRTCWSLRPDYCLDTHFVSPPLRHEHTRSQSPSSGYWYGGVTCKFTCHVTLATLQTTARARYGEWLTVPAPNGSQAISSLGAGL